MRKYLLILLLSFWLVGCNLSYHVKNSEYNYIRTSRYHNDINFDAKIVTSREDMIDCIGTYTLVNFNNFDTLNEYNDSFFENKSLIIVPLITPSGGDRYKIKSYKINGSEIILNVKATSKGVTCDLGEWFMILEINSNKVENIDKVSLNVNK